MIIDSKALESESECEIILFMSKGEDSMVMPSHLVALHQLDRHLKFWYVGQDGERLASTFNWPSFSALTKISPLSDPASIHIPRPTPHHTTPCVPIFHRRARVRAVQHGRTWLAGSSKRNRNLRAKAHVNEEEPWRGVPGWARSGGGRRTPAGSRGGNPAWRARRRRRGRRPRRRRRTCPRGARAAAGHG